MDALLNELHQTNVEILKRNQNGSEFSSVSPSLHAAGPLETDIDLVPDTDSSERDPFQTRNPYHVFQEDSRGWQDWNAMLDSLDHAEYTNLVSNGNGEFGGSNNRYPNYLEQTGGNGNSANRFNSEINYDTDDLGLRQVEDDEQSDTKVAAQKAAQQLDELLFSLGQFKMEQQRRQQDMGPVTTSNVREAPTTHHTTSQKGSSVNSNGSEQNSSRERATNGKLQRQPAKRINPVPTNGESKNGSDFDSNENSDHVLSDMMNDLSNELAQQGAITAPKGFCFACKKPIVGMLISAMDKDWHPEHFTCTNCTIGLVRANFYERDGQPYCIDCHAALFSPKCANCGEAILDKCIVSLGRTWHPEHFFCNGCYRGFTGQVTVHEHEDRIYCQSCYVERFGTRCSGCQQAITDAYITALDVPWHKNCFVCQDCGKPLTGSNFHEDDGLPYCETHFYTRRGLVCYSCSKPITGRCVNALGRRYHPEHFKCAYCLQALQSGTFKEHSNKPYCHQCFAQLFG